MTPEKGYKILDDIFNNDTAYQRGYDDGYNQALDDGIAKIEEMLSRVFNDEDDYYLGIENGYQDCIRELEQLKGEQI